MSSTIAWVFRYTPKSFLFGWGISVLSLATLFVVAPKFADAPFVPVPLAFGEMPWYVVLALGILLIVRAWAIAVRAKRRAGF